MDVKDKNEIEIRFTELWSEHEPYIRKLCNRKLKSMPHCADDCVQETFKALATALNKGTVIDYPKTCLRLLLTIKSRTCTLTQKEMPKELFILSISIRLIKRFI